MARTKEIKEKKYKIIRVYLEDHQFLQSQKKIPQEPICDVLSRIFKGIPVITDKIIKKMKKEEKQWKK